MTWYNVKLVPNAEPNADGEWAYHWHDEKPGFGETPLAPGRHIVAVQVADQQSSPPDQPFYMHSYLRGQT